MKSASKQSYKCQYCGTSYAREGTLFKHMCEPKRRFQQQNEIGVQWGFQAYLKFYEITQGSSKNKTYEDFTKSTFYVAFVKFGRYCVEIRCINFMSFLEWLLKKNKAIDYWCKDSLYDEWFRPYMQKEAVQDALERSLKEMQKYADEQEFNGGFSDYFRMGNTNRISHHISSGRISPWVLYHCDSGVAFLDGLNESQIPMILPYIDPSFWSKKFKDYPEDVMWVKSVLKEAGL